MANIFSSPLVSLADIKIDENNWPYRTVELHVEGGQNHVGDVYGKPVDPKDKTKGFNDSDLKVLDLKFATGAEITYTIRPKKTDATKNIITIYMDAATAESAAAKQGKPRDNFEKHFPDPIKVDPPINQQAPPSAQQPTPTAQPTLKPAEPGEPWMGYKDRDAMFRAKDGHFAWEQAYRMQRDARNDAQIQRQFYQAQAVQVVLAMRGDLSPNKIMELAMEIGDQQYAKYKPQA